MEDEDEQITRTYILRFIVKPGIAPDDLHKYSQSLIFKLDMKLADQGNLPVIRANTRHNPHRLYGLNPDIMRCPSGRNTR